MKYLIRGYNEHFYYHYCQDEDGREEFLDIFIDGTLDKRFKNPQSLVGKTIEVKSTHPYISIANNVSIVKPKENK